MDLQNTRILVSNDDGIHAPGLKVLEHIARSLSSDVWTVAPETEQSGASHSLTLHRPLRLQKHDERRYAVDGTPTDCVLLAVNEILKDKRPTLLLSGVNRGGNMGEDVTYSGTVAAAMEGTLMGLPSIAMSLAIGEGEEPDWSVPREYGAPLVRRLVSEAWPFDCLMNVNFPNVSAEAVNGIHAASLGRRTLGDNLARSTDPRGRPYYWIGPPRNEAESSAPGTDIHIVAENGISITPIFLDLTHKTELEALRERFP